MTALSLDCLTVWDATPEQLVRIAGGAGYAAVSLWVQPPALPGGTLAVPAMAEALRAAMADTGVRLGNLEVFNLGGEEALDAFRPALRFGASLGARSATAIDWGQGRADMPERLAAFAAMAAEEGLAVNIEPISMGNTRTLAEAAALIGEAGVEAGIVVDCVHLVRTGGGAASLAAIEPARIAYAQLCDGPAALPEEAWGAEATEERLYPGEGDFPLAAILRALPPGTPLAVEAPSRSRRARGLSPAARAQEALAATRRVLAEAF